MQGKEQSLVLEAQKGNPEAFGELYDRHFDRIYKYISFKVWNQLEAEDLTQQVFLKAFESIGSYKCRELPFSSWLYRIAHNQVIDYVRKRNRTVQVPLDETREAGGDSPAEIAEQKIMLEKIKAASEHLTEAQREVISLRFTSELPIAEVAKIMNKNEGAVKALQHSALAALRRLLPNEE